MAKNKIVLFEKVEILKQAQFILKQAQSM